MELDSSNSKPTPPKTRRWLRFSLRTALLLVTLLSIWLAWYVPRVQRQKAAVRWIESFGRTAYYSHMRKPQGQRDPPAPQWLVDIFGIDAFDTINMIWLDDKPVEDITLVRNLPNVNHFELTNGKLTDITPLSELSNLQHVAISKNQVSDIGPLSGLSNLMRFYAYKTAISDLTPLSRLYNLENLILSQTPVADITHLSKLTNLYNLELSETKIQDLTPLFGLVNLKTLDIRGNQLTMMQVEELRKQLPNCKVEF